MVGEVDLKCQGLGSLPAHHQGLGAGGLGGGGGREVHV